MINKLIFTLVFCFVLTTLNACTGNSSPPTLSNNNQIATAVSPANTSTPTPVLTEIPATATDVPTVLSTPTETPVPTESPTSVPNTSTAIDWIPYAIALYSLQLNLPPNWTIAEINRRAEPTEDWAIHFGHDCAEYNIANPDNTLQLSLAPGCGMLEGANFLCPPDTVIIGPSRYNISQIARFYDPHTMTYGYTETDDDRMYCADSPKISFADNDIDTYLLIEFNYTGNEAELPPLLEISDEIIRSIRSSP